MFTTTSLSRNRSIHPIQADYNKRREHFRLDEQCRSKRKHSHFGIVYPILTGHSLVRYSLRDCDSPKRPHFPFLKLPAEIRNHIYHLLLANGTVEIHNSGQQSRFGQERILVNTAAPPYYGPRRARGNRYLISILLVCSQIYHEAYLIPYTNTFVLVRCSSTFLDNRTPAQLRVIRSLIVACPVIRGGSYFRDFLHLAAEKLISLKELVVFVMIFRSGFQKGRSAPWIEGVEAWMGRGLEVGLVKSIGMYGNANLRPWEREVQKLVEALSKELTAGVVSTRLTAG